MRGGRFVELDQIAVLPEYRQSGVGHALAQCVFAYAHEVGATEIELTTWDFNGTARAFFANLGFRTSTFGWLPRSPTLDVPSRAARPGPSAAQSTMAYTAGYGAPRADMGAANREVVR